MPFFGVDGACWNIMLIESFGMVGFTHNEVVDCDAESVESDGLEWGAVYGSDLVQHWSGAKFIRLFTTLAAGLAVDTTEVPLRFFDFRISTSNRCEYTMAQSQHWLFRYQNDSNQEAIRQFDSEGELSEFLEMSRSYDLTDFSELRRYLPPQPWRRRVE